MSQYLLYRGSRDVFEFNIFHKICDNRSRTITIIKNEVNNKNNNNNSQEEINENGIEEETGRGVMDFRVVDLSKEFNDKQLNDENYENEYDE
ncbi:hypothetical protein RIR_jg17934.t1 [Rhizophagus irregularis DAOM 181602=DAOM 197198]|nr:hypothetical protein RIR_jg17934.t1 [Rhizophagus irregularis DAOM 181602=DAOM 197198]